MKNSRLFKIVFMDLRVDQLVRSTQGISILANLQQEKQDPQFFFRANVSKFLENPGKLRKSNDSVGNKR